VQKRAPDIDHTNSDVLLVTNLFVHLSAEVDATASKGWIFGKLDGLVKIALFQFPHPHCLFYRHLQLGSFTFAYLR
jgi:hypothetical protein